MNKSIVKDIIEWIICIIVAVVIALLIRYYIGTPTIVKKTSMSPTLVQDDRLWLNRWGKTTGEFPERGDIITFEAPSQNQIFEDEVDLTNPVAKYEYEPETLWENFKYNVLEKEKTSYIKRVIALPGEFIEIKDGAVYIDGNKLEENYLQDGVITDMMQGIGFEGCYTGFTIPENSVYCLGDNREGSTDSRSFGCIPLEKIEGKVAFRFWPFSKFGEID